MPEQPICHWLLYQPNGKCHSAFAPSGDVFDGYYRVGPVAVSPQFNFPLVFAMRSQDAGQSQGDCTKIRFEFLRDEATHPSPAFRNMAPLKIATLVAELAGAIAHWVNEVGAEFKSLRIDSDSAALELSIDVDSSGASALRSVELMKAGIEMMSYSRGLVVKLD